MGKKLRKQLTDLIQIIEKREEGISVGELSLLLTDPMARRSLQYRLSSLVKRGVLKRKGMGRSSRYYLSNREEKRFLDPVLACYHPNKSNYLSLPVLDQLFQMGSTIDKYGAPANFAKRIYPQLVTDLAWNSTRLEGNKVAFQEAEQLIKGILAPLTIDHQLILNHRDAIQFLIKQDGKIDLPTILHLGTLLAKNLPSRESRFSDTLFVSKNDFETIIDKGAAIKNPFEQACFLMFHLHYLAPSSKLIHRVARVATNISLIRNNLVPISFIDLPISRYLNSIASRSTELFSTLFIAAYHSSASLYLAISNPTKN